MVRELYDGTRKTGLTVREDAFWPGMWRIYTPDGKFGDMVNISRATDAGLSWLSRTNARNNPDLAIWKVWSSPQRDRQPKIFDQPSSDSLGAK